MRLICALKKLKAFQGLTEQELAWVLYDVGNSAYTMLACSLIPIWFKSVAVGHAPGQISSDNATAYYSLAVSIVTVAVALLGPVLGALADHKDKKRMYFTSAAALGMIFCVLTGFAWSWLLFLILFVVTKICYSASLTIYDSMLGDITTEDRMDEVSSNGFASGIPGVVHPVFDRADRLCAGAGHGRADSRAALARHRRVCHGGMVADGDGAAAARLHAKELFLRRERVGGRGVPQNLRHASPHRAARQKGAVLPDTRFFSTSTAWARSSTTASTSAPT